MEDAAWWLTGRLDAQLAFLDSLGLTAKCYLGLPGATQSRLGPPILIIHQDTPPQTSLIQIIPQLKPLPLVILACGKLTFKTNHPICSETESLNHEVILFLTLWGTTIMCSMMAEPAHSPIHSVRVLVLLHLLQSTSTICSKRDSMLQGPALSMEATFHQSSLWSILCLLPSLWEAETLFVSFLPVFDI